MKGPLCYRNDRRRQSRIPKLGGGSRALLLVLVLLSRPEEWLQSRSRLGLPCRAIRNLSCWTQHAGIMSTMRQSTGSMRSGWSVGIGWLISGRACNSPQRFWLIWTLRGLSVFKLGLQVVVSVFVFVFLFFCFFVFLFFCCCFLQPSKS